MERRLANAQQRRRPGSLLFAIVVVVILAGGAYWYLAQGPGRSLLSPSGSAVVRLSGDGDQTTESFTVRQGWAIEWDSSGDAFAFAIRGDRDFGTVIDVVEPGNGVTSPTGEGTFHLEVAAEGPWTITVKQGN